MHVSANVHTPPSTALIERCPRRVGHASLNPLFNLLISPRVLETLTFELDSAVDERITIKEIVATLMAIWFAMSVPLFINKARTKH